MKTNTVLNCVWFKYRWWDDTKARRDFFYLQELLKETATPETIAQH